MSDIAHIETDVIINDTERELRRVYLRAQTETQAKLDNYLKAFAEKDEIKRAQLARGEITQGEYSYWRTGQICMGKRWREMVDTLAEDYTNADKIAMSIANGYMPDVYALNHNYGTFQIEHDSLVNTSYTLYDRQTVERLIKDNPNLLPKARVDIPKDKRWNKQHIANEITQSIMQGEDINKVAKRLQKVTDMDKRAAVRNARTIITGAENAGRIDSYKRAEEMGINLKQEWVATLDGRTRHSHRQLDGEKIKVGEKFSNGLRFPGDPDGYPGEVYNCRCTLVADIDGVDTSDAERSNKLGNMSYEEWKHEHENYQVKLPDLQSKIGGATTVQQINDVMNSQGWFRTNPAGITSMTDLTGCDLESAKSVAATYQQVFEKYPQLKGKLDAPDAHPIGMESNTYAWCYIRNNGKVQVNPNRYNSWQSVVASYDRDVLSKWHPYGTTAESIVTHELGHAVDGLLAREGILGGVTSSGEYRYASSSLRSTIMKRAAKLNPNIANGLNMHDGMSFTVANYVSRYASKNPQEWFAECFAEYITSANPRLIASEFGKELEKLIGRLV